MNLDRTYIYPYHPASAGARELLNALDIHRIRRTFRPQPDKCIINWGRDEMPPGYNVCVILNSPMAVATAADKRAFFQTYFPDDYTSIHGARCVPYATRWEDAAQWIDQGRKVVGRQFLRSSNGKGILIVDRTSPLALLRQASRYHLWTKYIPKKNEYRFHFMNGQVFAIQKKVFRRREGRNARPENFRVRNWANGFTFIRNGFNVEDVVHESVNRLLNDLELKFGAIDVIYNENQGIARILEVNTAPGIEGQTIQDYARVFREYIRRI